jgi:hypothetical protein
MASKTIYENVKSDFYSVERAGYTTVSSAMYDVVTDLLNHGFTQANVSFTDSSGNPNFSTWPPIEVKFSTVTPGVGYKVGDQLQMIGGNVLSTPFQMTVDSVNATTLEILSYTINSSGSYTDLPTSPVSFEFQSTYTTPTITITAAAAVSNSGDAAPAAITPLTVITGVPQSTNPTSGPLTAFPDHHYSIVNAQGVVLQAADMTSYVSSTVPSTRQPHVLWMSLTGTNISRYKVGSLVVGTGVPANTSIVSVVPFASITGVAAVLTSKQEVVQGSGNKAYFYQYSETTTPAFYVVLSHPVTLAAGDVVGIRGNNFTMDNTGRITPIVFTAIVEAGAAVDPLNDSVGVFANVATISTSSTTLLVNNMIGSRIYPGQLVNSTLLAGSISGVTTVVSVVNTGTTANVTLSKPQTCPDVGEQLHFIFVDTQPWRLAIQALSEQTSAVYAATPIQLTDLGKIATITNGVSSTVVDKAGAMGSQPLGSGASPQSTDPAQGFNNRTTRVGSSPEAFPMNYILTITNRGAFLGMWEGTWSTLQRATTSSSSYFNWMLVQRPVNRLTGDTLTAGRAPVFCINSVGYKYWKFIVREADVLHPSQGDPTLQSYVYDPASKTQVSQTTPYRVPADTHSADSFAILNTTNQIALTEDSKYLIGFLHNLTTPRFRYSEELDIIGQTSADVCGAGNDVEITAYSESGPRQYRALPSNNVYNTGLRICVLKDTPI